MRIFFLLFFIGALSSVSAQPFTSADSIRGGLTPERIWWDLQFYDLNVSVDPEQRSIEGTNLVRFTALRRGQRVQIDLQQPMELTAITTPSGEALSSSQRGDAYYIDLPRALEAGEQFELLLTFSGKPRVARNPPWDGGLTWATDKKGKPFVANSNQGIGPSVWWPCKDHPADEVDSMAINVTVPRGLVDVSNGRLRKVSKAPGKRRTYHWFVANPINSYGVNLSVGDYASWAEKYQGENGRLACSYYVLKPNKKKAREQFRQVPLMLAAFEHWFGPYPFYEDGFKLVEVPYLGMEHQSAVTYGNGFQNGYRGKDLSGTGEGLKFDFIIIHEAGHEWFANNVTNADVADMWIHEGFTAYSENLYLDYHFGKASASKYVIGTRAIIRNDRPIKSPYRGVDHSGSGDMYYKGANLLHTLRQVVNNDEEWRSVLRGINQKFRHQTITSDELVAFFDDQLEVDGLNLPSFFRQYTETTRIPTLEYYFSGPYVNFRWVDVVDSFAMPVEVNLGEAGKYRLNVKTDWQKIKITKRVKTFSVDPDYYVNSRRVKGN